MRDSQRTPLLSSPTVLLPSCSGMFPDSPNLRDMWVAYCKCPAMDREGNQRGLKVYSTKTNVAMDRHINPSSHTFRPHECDWETSTSRMSLSLYISKRVCENDCVCECTVSTVLKLSCIFFGSAYYESSAARTAGVVLVWALICQWKDNGTDHCAIVTTDQMPLFENCHLLVLTCSEASWVHNATNCVWPKSFQKHRPKYFCKAADLSGESRPLCYLKLNGRLCGH